MERRTCYSETTNLLYSQNTFSFDEANLVVSFFDGLLPSRRAHVTSIHICWSFWMDQNSVQYAFIYLPKGDRWGSYCDKLKQLPNLRHLAVAPTFYRRPTRFMNRNERRDYKASVRFHLGYLNDVPVRDTFSVTVPWAPDSQNHPDRPSFSTDDLLPPIPKFEVKRIVQRSPVRVDQFRFPFRVKCLHCDPGVIIHKGHITDAEWLRLRNADFAPYGSVWMFHTACGGWIEFEYERNEGNRRRKWWRVTQGAKKVGNEDGTIVVSTPSESLWL
ncbi:hypothetical protein P154DRAFT_533440 [Amniculicola lignicola CBS 123094]|uniref:DUF7730 domain-containing protein n=1 Tax=Amniculicola lignicola CBS 123094 TaxID=1392246 RepID=A0A6A5WRW5_9PLEO|nr:hypothetical protein P154DRAFT_533440 [Amniculicola lignicola CBS 123094]